MMVPESSEQTLDITAIKPEQWEALETLRRDAFSHIEQLVEEIRQCRKPEHYRVAQQHLSEHIERIDTSIGEAKRRISHAKRNLRRLYKRNISTDSPEMQEVAQERQVAYMDYNVYSSLARQYRLVGDAIAWQIYDFQALPVYDWGLNQGAGVITGEQQEGVKAETGTIEQLWNDEGAFALRHDYTNCLRVGNLSILYPNRTELPTVKEVKVTGRSVLPHEKEMQRRGLALIANNEYSAPGKALYVQRTISSQTSTMNLLFQAIAQARTASVGQVTNSYLAITVMDETNPAGRLQDDMMKEWKKLTEEFITPDIWPTTCSDYLSHTSYRKNTMPSFSAPYTIYPLPSDYVAGLATGYLMVHYRLNTAAITQAFQKAGFNAICRLGEWRAQGGEPPKRIPSPCFIVGRGSWMVPLSATSVEQILCDGLSLEDLVASVVELYQSNALKNDTIRELERFLVTFTYTGLENIWRSSLTYVDSAENEEEVVI